MNRRPNCICLSAFALGVAAGAYNTWHFYAAAAFVLLCFFYSLQGKGRNVRGYFILFLLLFLAGEIRFRTMDMLFQEREAQFEDGDKVQLQGKIYHTEEKNERMLIYLKDCLVKKGQTIYSYDHILCYFDTGKFLSGTTITGTGTIKRTEEPRNEGSFDERAYYRSRKIQMKVFDAKLTGTYGKTDFIAECLQRLRGSIFQTYQKLLGEEEAGILSAMVLGERSQLLEETKQLYQKAGISHILAISGLHISILGMGVYHFLRKRRLSFQSAGLACGFLLLFYAKMTGGAVSAIRAVFMCLLAVYAPCRKRSYDSFSALLAAAFLLLLDNPFLITYAGFLFSFLAVSGVLFANEILINRSGPKRKWLETLWVSASIQLLTLPVLIQFYYEVPVYSVFINLLVLPFMGSLFVSALLGGLMGCLFLPAGRLCLIPASLLLGFYEKVCLFFTGLPKANTITGHLNIHIVFLYYAVLALGILLPSALKGKKRQIMRYLCILSAMPLLLTGGGKGERIAFLDVGQGDGIFMETADHLRIFIDGGSSSVKNTGMYRILPFFKYQGVPEIDYWFVSHADLDHISGLEEILEDGYPVKHMVFSQNIIRDEAFARLEEKAGKNGSRIYFMRAGEELKGKRSSFTCLFPDGDFENSDRNAQSLCLLYQSQACTALFTGDISTEEEKRLLGKEKLPRLTLYKAAHHGSNGSNGDEILKAAKPEISVISCAEKNRYGHPGKEAVKRLLTWGKQIYYTMEGGQITVYPEEGNTQVLAQIK